MRLLTILTLSLVTATSTYADCTRDQAFNKMMKLNQLSSKLQAEVPLDPSQDPAAMNSSYERMKEYSDRMSPAGSLLATGKYNEACKIYDATAKHFGFNLAESDAVTMDQLKENGGKKATGDCDITEMAKKSVQLSLDFQTAYQGGSINFEQQRQFSKDSEKLSMLATSDPGAACREILVLRKKYGL